MAVRFLFFTLSFWLIACTSTQEKASQTHEEVPGTLPELTNEQVQASEALNKLQRQSGGHLYSTFGGIDQPSYPPDTTFVISQEEMLKAMSRLISIHSTSLSLEKRDQLVKQAVLAQDEYLVLHTFDSFQEQNDTSNSQTYFSMSGTWVMPNIFGRSDLVYIW